MKNYIKLVLIFFVFVVFSTNVFAANIPPKEPVGGFKVVIENGAEITNDRSVVILLNGGIDVKMMAISERSDFFNASYFPYQGVSEFILSEEEGQKEVFVKLLSISGAESKIFSSKIIYQKPYTTPDQPKDPKTISGDDLEPGNLFKTNISNAVYYYGYDKKRYVFPTERVFYSWYTQDDFENVKIVTPETLSIISIGGNVVYRPGKKLIKIRTNPKVFAVGFYGTLHWIQTEEIARNLYGPNWTKQIDDIPVTLFGNYEEGYTISSTDQIPDGVLFTIKGDNTVYISDNGVKRPFVTQYKFFSNRFTFDMVRNYEDVTLPDGEPVSGPEKKYFDTAAKKEI